METHKSNHEGNEMLREIRVATFNIESMHLQDAYLSNQKTGAREVYIQHMINTYRRH